MKKMIKALTAVTLCAVLALGGCSGGSEPGKVTVPRTAAPTEYKLTESKDAGNSGDVKLEKGDIYAVISVKDFGDIKVKLYPDLVPYGVYNFVELANSGVYNGRNFHRIVENFMIQGGSESGDGAGGKDIDGGSFKNEVNTSLRHYYGALCFASNAIGDLSDGFYIVNSKKPQDDLDYVYNKVAENSAKEYQYAQAILQSITPDIENYQKIKTTYESKLAYNEQSFYGVAAMYNNITDEVRKTYTEKGGKAELDGCYTVFGQTVEGFDVIDKITAVEKTTGNDGDESKPVKEIIIDKIEIFTME